MIYRCGFGFTSASYSKAQGYGHSASVSPSARVLKHQAFLTPLVILKLGAE